jgi:DNA-binding transcriptional LysR family regulator
LTNNGGALCAMMVEGVGLGAAPSYLVRADLDAGRIEPVLLDWKVLPEVRLYAVYPHRRFLAPKVRAFVEALRATYGDGTKDPWWPETAAVRLTKREPTKRAAKG